MRKAGLQDYTHFFFKKPLIITCLYLYTFIVHFFVKCMMNCGLHMTLGVRYNLYIFIFMSNTY